MPNHLINMAWPCTLQNHPTVLIVTFYNAVFLIELYIGQLLNLLSADWQIKLLVAGWLNHLLMIAAGSELNWLQSSIHMEFQYFEFCSRIQTSFGLKYIKTGRTWVHNLIGMMNDSFEREQIYHNLHAISSEGGQRTSWSEAKHSTTKL